MALCFGVWKLAFKLKNAKYVCCTKLYLKCLWYCLIQHPFTGHPPAPGTKLSFVKHFISGVNIIGQMTRFQKPTPPFASWVTSVNYLVSLKLFLSVKWNDSSTYLVCSVSCEKIHNC